MCIIGQIVGLLLCFPYTHWERCERVCANIYVGPYIQWLSGMWLAVYGGLNENIFYTIRHLATWSLVGGPIWEVQDAWPCWRKYAVMGLALRVSRLKPLPTHPLCFLFVVSLFKMWAFNFLLVPWWLFFPVKSPHMRMDPYFSWSISQSKHFYKLHWPWCFLTAMESK